jgi:hypothetical protein
MVDKELNFVVRNEQYGYRKEANQQNEIVHRLTYSDGKYLAYGDPAEIFSAVSSGAEFIIFMQSALFESGFYKEHYNFTLGYQPADFENEEIKENEVKIHYAGVDNTISKKEFYDLCLLLCDAKLNGLDLIEDKEVSRDELLSIKSQLEEKIKEE